jgi:glutathione peroxidase
LIVRIGLFYIDRIVLEPVVGRQKTSLPIEVDALQSSQQARANRNRQASSRSWKIFEGTLNKQLPKARRCHGWRVAAIAAYLLVWLSHAFAKGMQGQPPVSPKSTTGVKSKGAKAAPADDAKSDKSKSEKTVYDFNLPGPDGKDIPLAQYKGKYIVLVNLGRKSSYNEQLGALTKLSDLFKDKGVVVLGVPSNDFGLAEPGTPADVQKAYTEAKVNFPVMALSKVSGDDELPLYGFLTKGKNALPGGPVHWNYTKFIIGPKGQALARLDPDVAPDSPQMLSTMDQILDGTWKPKKAEGKGPGAKAGEAADDDDDD